MWDSRNGEVYQGTWSFPYPRQLEKTPEMIPKLKLEIRDVHQAIKVRAEVGNPGRRSTGANVPSLGVCKYFSITGM